MDLSRYFRWVNPDMTRCDACGFLLATPDHDHLHEMWERYGVERNPEGPHLHIEPRAD